jgi:nucleotide-binding universal stress UspA family protein
MYKRILVPVDGSDTSNKALVAALQLARDGGGRVRVIHVFDVVAYMTGFEFGADILDQARAYARKTVDDAVDIAKAAGVQVDGRLLDMPGRSLGEVVAEEATRFESDLVVVGTHGRRGVGRVLLGSGAEEVIRLAPVPVLVVRATAPRQETGARS